MLKDVMHLVRYFMHYILKKSRPSSKKGIYLQIYINDYISGKGKVQRSYESLGYLEDLISPSCPDPIAFYTDKVKKLNDELKEKSVKQIGEVTPTKNLGYFLIKAMFDKLNLDNHIRLASSNKKFQFDLPDFIRTITYAQIINPGSKFKAFEKVIPSIYGTTEYSYDQILETIDFLGQDYESFIEILNHHINKIYKRNTKTTYFDCTNYYFEIDEEDNLRRKGPSKENRHDPIIGQALLLDEDQIPLAMTMYPGNESEKPYLRNTIEDIKNRYNISSRIVQVADKGLNCARNIYAASIEANDGYIFSKSVHGKNLSKQEKDWILLDNENNVWNEVKDSNGKLIYKYKECIDTFEYKFTNEEGKCVAFNVNEKRIVIFNPTLARKQKQEINKEIEKAKSLSLKCALKEEYGDSTKYIQFTTTDNNGEKVYVYSSLNQDKINEDLSYAGYNLLVTSEVDKTSQEIYKAYHGLWRIEESFRVMKTYLDARPVFLQNENSIYGHFLICYYALTILRLIELKVFNDELPIGQIIDYVRDFNITEYSPNQFINNTHPRSIKNEIKSKLGLSQLTYLYLNKKDVDNILNAYFD